MDTSDKKTYYVYALARPNERVFYVGKGRGRRVFIHEWKARHGYRDHKSNIIRKIWRQGGEVQRYILFTTDNEQEAYDYEREMIALYGRDHLANQTDGGASAFTLSEEARARMAEAAKARFSRPEERIKQASRMRGRKQAPATLAKRGAKLRAHWADPEARARHLAAMRAGAARLEVRAQRSATMKLRYTDPAERAKLRAQSEAARADPAIQAKMRDAIKKAYENPELRAKIGEKSKAFGNTPEERARRRARGKKRYENPEERAKSSTRFKAMWADPVKRAEILAKRRTATERRKAQRDQDS
jgi:hypothetical protein